MHIKRSTTLKFLAVLSIVTGLGLSAPAAEAFEIGMGFSINPLDNVEGADLAMRFGDVTIHSEGYHEEVWNTLRNADEFAHNLGLEDQHACMYVKKIEALLRQMYENLEHYKTYSNPRLRAEAIASERASIQQWEVELRKAKRECRKWY